MFRYDLDARDIDAKFPRLPCVLFITSASHSSRGVGGARDQFISVGCGSFRTTANPQKI